MGKEKIHFGYRIFLLAWRMTMPNRIRFWRQQKGWTLQQLADAAGTTRAQIDKLERGTRRLTVDWMVRLAAPLGCDPRSLMAMTGLAETVQHPLTVPALPLLALRLRQNRATRTATTGQPPFAPPPRHAAASYAVTLPSTWQSLLRVPAHYALVQPQAPVRRGALALLGLPDGSWQCGWLLAKSQTGVNWQQLGEKPRRLPSRAYTDLHPITALYGDA